MTKCINKKNILKNILKILILLFIFNIIMMSTNVYGMSDIIFGGKKFLRIGEEGLQNELNDPNGIQSIDESQLQKASGEVYNVFLVLGIAAAVIVGMVMGIKFITGSIDEKADVKNSLIPYVAGCVVVFGAFAIWKFVLNIIQGIPT